MKKITIIFVLFALANVYSQRIRPYVGFAIYRHTDFSNSVFLSLKTGGEVKINKYLKPEIEFSLLAGAPEDFTKRDENIISYTRKIT